MLTSLYMKIGGFTLVLSILGGIYYSVCYSPKKKLEKSIKKTAKDLRAEYIKNSALELELVMCIGDKEALNFESEMRGAGDEVEDFNPTTDSNKLIF